MVNMNILINSSPQVNDKIELSEKLEEKLYLLGLNFDKKTITMICNLAQEKMLSFDNSLDKYIKGRTYQLKDQQITPEYTIIIKKIDRGIDIYVNLNKKIGKGGCAKVVHSARIFFPLQNSSQQSDVEAYREAKVAMLIEDKSRRNIAYNRMKTLQILGEVPNIVLPDAMYLSQTQKGENKFEMQVPYCDMDFLEFIRIVNKNKTKISNENILKVILDISRSLKALHEGSKNRDPYVHRDLKPENLLVNFYFDSEGQIIVKEVKLNDFDFACSLKDKKSLMDFRGTYSYLAPEEFYLGYFNYLPNIKELLGIGNNDKILGMIGTAADMWALGCTIYYFAYGKQLNFMEVQYQIQVIAESLHEANRKIPGLMEKNGAIIQAIDEEYHQINTLNELIVSFLDQSPQENQEELRLQREKFEKRANPIKYIYLQNE